MWLSFFLAIPIAVLFLYVPGIPFVRALALRDWSCLCCAPAITVALYSVLAVALSKAGIACSWISVFFAATVVGLLLWAALALIRHGAKKPSRGAKKPAKDFLVIVLYVVAGLFIGALTFLRALDGPASFSQMYDDMQHMGLVRSFLETGSWSTFATTIYPDAGVSGGFYPAAWHLLCAMFCDATGAPVAIGINAVTYAIVAVLFPLGLLYLLWQVTDDRRVICFGAVLCLLLEPFPLHFLVYGKLAPNMLGFCFIPMVAGLFINVFRVGEYRSRRIGYFFLVIVSLVAVAVSHPNSVFALVLILWPYCALRLYELVDSRSGSLNKPHALAWITVFIFWIITVAIWYVCFKLPFLQSQTSFYWWGVVGTFDALIQGLTFANTQAPANLLATVLLLLGIKRLFVKERKAAWLVLSYAIVLFVFVVDAGTEGIVKSILSGFWYTDYRRLGGLVALAGLPILCFGAAELCEWLGSKLSKACCKEVLSRFGAAAVSVVFCLLMLAPSFSISGWFDVYTPYSFLLDWGDQYYSGPGEGDEMVYSEYEQAFVNRAVEITGDDVVLNTPHDGSQFAYQASGLKTVYRFVTFDSNPYEIQAGLSVVRQHLDEFATNEEVRAAVEAAGARYLLVLEQGHDPYDHTEDWPFYDSADWVGMQAVRDDTPGFEVVLSEGDMRLYRILY